MPMSSTIKQVQKLKDKGMDSDTITKELSKPKYSIDSDDLGSAIVRVFRKGSLMAHSRMAAEMLRIAEEDHVVRALSEMGLAFGDADSTTAGPDDIRWQAVFFIGPAGAGKCFGEGTEILMADGTIKNVEDIVDGDLVMGDDSTPRKVLETHTGIGELYEVVPTKGDSFVVNENHELVFKALEYNRKTVDGRRKKSEWKQVEVEMPVSEFLCCGKGYQKEAKLFRVEVNFPEKKVTIPPYILGAWLGDGDAHRFAITTMDKEVEKSFREFVSKYDGVDVREEKQKRGKAKQFHATTHNCHIGSQNSFNPIMDELRRMGAMPEKRIPSDYLINSDIVRLEVLAGLVDTDGSLSNGCFEITQKRYSLSCDIVRLARSLGFYASMSAKTINGKIYYRMMISGDIDRIPTRLKRKKASGRNQKKNVLHVGFSVHSIGEGRYFGFEVDGNHRHLLADCTVVHNSFVRSKKYMKYMNFKLIDPDEVKKRHPDYDPDNPYKVHAWSKEVSDAEFRAVVTDGTGAPVIVDGTGRSAGPLAKKIQFAKENGYRTFLVYVWVPFEVSIFRNRSRERFVPEETIIEQHQLITKSFGALKNVVDQYKAIPNYTSADLAEAKADVDIYPVPQRVRPPRPGDPDYGVAVAASVKASSKEDKMNRVAVATELLKLAKSLIGRSMYKGIIKDALKRLRRPDIDPRHVEGYLRLKYHTLDSLSKEDFLHETKDIIKDIDADPSMAERLADSYGVE